MNTHKYESRIRTGAGEIKGLPGDLHAELSRQRTQFGYGSMWITAIAAMRHGLRVMQAQADRAEEIFNEIGNRRNER